MYVYVDVDLVGDIDSRKITIGYVYILGGTIVSWVSKLQKIVALSTIEAKCVVVIEASKEMMWLWSFLEELGHKYEWSVLHYDSQSTIHLAKYHVYHAKTKHTHVWYHFIRPTLEDEVLILEKI